MSAEELLVTSGSYSGAAHTAAATSGQLVQVSQDGEAQTLYGEASGEVSNAGLFASEAQETVSAARETDAAIQDNNAAQAESETIIGTLMDKISDVVTTILGLDNDIQTKDTEIGAKDAEITGLEAQKGSLDAQASSLEGSDDQSTRQQAAAIRSQAQVVQGQIQAAEAEKTALEGEKDKLEDEKGAQEGEQASLEGEKAGEEQTLTGLQADGTALQGQADQIDADAQGQGQQGQQGQQDAESTAQQAEQKLAELQDAGGEQPDASAQPAAATLSNETTYTPPAQPAATPQPVAETTPAAATPEAATPVAETETLTVPSYDSGFIYNDPYSNPYARIEGNMLADFEMASVIVDDMFFGLSTGVAADDMVGMNAMDAVAVAGEAYMTETYSNAIYSQKVSSNTDTATVEENQKAITAFNEAYSAASEMLNNPDVQFLSLTDESNYEMAAKIAERLDNGEYILTREIEKATQTVQSIQVSAVETEDEENTKFEAKGNQLLGQLKAVITDDENAPEDENDNILTQKEYDDSANFFESSDDKVSAYEQLVKDAQRYGVYAA